MTVTATPTQRQQERYAERRRAVIEDAEWLLMFRTHPEDIARRLGYKDRRNLARRLHRLGRPDLAGRIERKEQE